MTARSSFTDFVTARRRAGTLIVQPRMGFGDAVTMRRGLLAVRAAGGATVGTITLDSHTRQNDHDRAAMALRSGVDLNGYPLVAQGSERTASMLCGVARPGFPIQVRHGCARPERVIETMLAAGLDSTEGGPVSYCLPYGRVRLTAATRSWERSVRLLARQADRGVLCHLETFGGCMLGQLCPPSMLVALSVLECLFFVEHGLRSVSASYAQQTNTGQDVEAIGALRRLCGEELSHVDHHIVLYTYMGQFPESARGARALIADSARLAARTGVERLIVKTTAEAHRIPTIEENVEALRLADECARNTRAGTAPDGDSEVYQEARSFVDTVRELAPSLSVALPLAFERGLLDVPYCLHPDNRNETRGVLDADGRLVWWDTGRLPVRGTRRGHPPARAAKVLADLAYHRGRLDRLESTA